MKQNMKKSLALLLTLCMLLGLMPPAAFAEEVVDESTTWSLTLTAGVGMTGENLEQTIEKGQPILPVTLTATEGYAFPETYTDSTLEAVGLAVLREDETKITISGTPTATLALTLPDAAVVEAEKMPEEFPVEEDGLDAVALAAPRAAARTYTQNATLAGGDLSGTLTVNPGVTVTVTGTIAVTSGLTIQGGGTLKRGPSFTGDMFKVESGTLTMENIALDGASVLAAGSAVAIVGGASSGGTFVMNGGVIQNFRRNAIPGGAAVLVGVRAVSQNEANKKAVFKMNGGTIKDNKFESGTAGVGGGAVAVLGTFIMDGGLITNNYSGTNGGAIGVLANNPGGRFATAQLGGTAAIVGNTARRWGGAIEAMANRDCGGTPQATLTIAGNTLITGNLSNYDNSKANDGFGGGVEISEWENSTFTVGGAAKITGNNHWASGKYTQDNLYCDPAKANGGMPMLVEAFTGSIGVSPANGQSAGATFGSLNSKTVAEGKFFYDGKNLVNRNNTMVWQAPSTAKPVGGASIALSGSEYKATVTPTGVTATYQWYVSSTNSVGGGLPIPGANGATYTPTGEYEGMYLYVIADGTDGATGRANSNLVQVKPSAKLTGLTFAPGSLLPAFTQSKTSYTLTVLAADKTIAMKATATGAIEKVTANGVELIGASGSYTIPAGTTTVVVTVGGKDYTVAVSVPGKPVITGDYTLYYNATDRLMHKGSLNGAVLAAVAGEYEPTDTGLKLDGFNFTTSAPVALVLPAGMTLELTGESRIIANGRLNTSAEENCGILSNDGGLTIQGTGSLTVKGASTGMQVKGLLTVKGAAIVTAEGTGFLGTSYDKADTAGIYAMDGTTVEGTANVTAIAGSSNRNSYGLGASGTGTITVKGTAILTAIGGQAMKPRFEGADPLRSMGINAGKFVIAESGTVVAHGEHMILNYKAGDAGTTDFGGAVIEAAKNSNGSGDLTYFKNAGTGGGAGTEAAPKDYATLIANQKAFATKQAETYKWVQLYLGTKPVVARTETPAFSPASGQYAGQAVVNLFSATGNNTVYYTTDGTVPTATNGTKYVAPFTVSSMGKTTVKAVAIAGGTASAVAEATYTIVEGVNLRGLTMTATDATAKVTNLNLSPSFSKDQFNYRVVAPQTTKSISVAPNAGGAPVAMTVGGTVVRNPIAITDSSTVLTITVGTAPVTATYTVTLVKNDGTGALVTDTYEPLTITSGYNKDVVVEKPGTPSSFAVPFDGVNASAQFAFYAPTRSGAGALPADRKVVKDIGGVAFTYQLADYAEANSIQLTAQAPNATVQFSTIGTYDQLSLLGASANGASNFSVTIHYTDGEKTTTSFASNDWYYSGSNKVISASRIKLAGNTVGSIETGPALMYYNIPVTQGKLVSYLTISRTGGSNVSWTNIMAISGVISKGSLTQPERTEPAEKQPGQSDFNLSWKNNESAIAYYIDIAADENFTDMMPGYNNKRLEPGDYTVDDSVVPAAVKYVVPGDKITSDPAHYRVRAVNLDGKQSQSSPSSTIEGGGEASLPGGQAGLSLNTPAIVGEGKYSFSNAIVTAEAKTIIVGFSNAVNPGDNITLPEIPGFIISAGSNGYSKRITVAAGKTSADIQEYLRQIVFTLGKDGQDVQVTLSSQVISNDTYYFETTGHYYQFVPWTRGDSNKGWTNAYDAAKKATYAGRTGYLATVTSKDEDMFIKSLSGQIGWLGGTQMFDAAAATKVNVNDKEHAVPTPDSPADTDPLNLYYKSTDINHSGDSDRNWIWACGPEIGTAISTNQGAAVGGAYKNWNSGEPSGHNHGGKPASDDQHECALTTLFQGSAGYSWNDRAVAANVYGSGVTAGYQPYGYFVEYGDKTTGDTLGDATSGVVVTDSKKIEKAKAATDAGAGGAESLDLSKLPEVKKPISSDPNWQPIPGTNPAEYIYVGQTPATGEGWEWHYSEPDNYILVLKGVNIVTTQRPAIQMPALPSIDPEKPVYIRVMDGTDNSIENLEDNDFTTDVTVVHSSHSLIIEPSGPKNDGTLTLKGGNMAASTKGVYGIVSQGDVTIGSLKMTIELTDNRKTDGTGYDSESATTGAKADGDITLNNPELKVNIHDKRTPAATSPDILTPPARGLEPGYRDNVIVNGGPMDVVIDPKGDQTYPDYKPVIVDGEEISADSNGDGVVDDNDTPIFPIKPPKPAAEKMGQNIYVYANGSAILVQEGAASGQTSIYHDANRDGIQNTGDVLIDAATTDIDNASQIIYIYAGAKNVASSGWPLITINGGMVNYIYAGGRANRAEIVAPQTGIATLTGTPVITVTGGHVKEIYDGGTNTSALENAKTEGLVTINVSGTGIVDRITSRADTRTRADSVLVNLAGGEVGTLTPNTENPITLNVEKSARVKALGNYQALAGKKVNIVGKLESDAFITYEVSPAILTPGTILATATDAAFIGGVFALRDSATGFTAKGKQAIVEGVNIKIAEGGPSKLDQLDLGAVQEPTENIHPGWTGPDKDGNFVYNQPADKSEGWELKYEPNKDADGNLTGNGGEYILGLKGLNLDVENSPAIQLPKDQPTILKVEGENKLVVRGDVNAPANLIGIDAPKGVTIEGDNKTEDILNITVDNSGNGGAIGVKSENEITIIDAAVNINLPGRGSPAKGLEAKGDVTINDGDITIDIPTAAPAIGITTPGNIVIEDTKPDGKRPTIEIDIKGDPAHPSTGMETTTPGNTNKGDIINRGGDIIIEIDTGKPAKGIAAADDVIILPGEDKPTDPGKPVGPGNPLKPGDKPNVDITIGDDTQTPKRGGLPATGIEAGNSNTGDDIYTDPDADTDTDKNGGILIGDGADVAIYIPVGPTGYPTDPTTPNRGLDSKDDIIITNPSTNVDVEMVGPGTAIKGDSDVIVKDADITIDIKNDPSDPDGPSGPLPAGPVGPIAGIEGENVVIKDTDPTNPDKPQVDITVGDKDIPNSGGTPSIGIKAEEDVILGGVDLDITIPVTGKPSKGIVAEDDVIILPGEPGKKPDGTPDHDNKPGEKPSVDIIIGDKDDPKPSDGPSTGIEANDTNPGDGPEDEDGNKQDGILIGDGDLTIDIPNIPVDYKPNTSIPYDEEKNGPNKGLDSKKDINISGPNGKVDIDITGPGVGIKGDGDVNIKDKDVDVNIKRDPTSPDGPIVGVDAGNDVVIKDTDPTDGKKPEVNINIGDKDIPNSGGAPSIGINTDPEVFDPKNVPTKDGGDVIVGGVDLGINIPTGKPAIGIKGDDDVIIQPGDPGKDANGNVDPNKPGEKPGVDVIIGDKDDPTTGGSPGTGIKADNKDDSDAPNGVDIKDADVNVDVTTRPGITVPGNNPGDPDQPDTDKPSSGIESKGDVNIKDSDVDVSVEDKTLPVGKKGETDGIKADGDVTAEDSNMDIGVTGRPGTGIKPNADKSPTGNGKVNIKGDTALDVNVKPGDPGYDDDGDGNTDNDNSGVKGDLIIDLDPPSPGQPTPKPNINVNGEPGVSGDVEDPHGNPPKDPEGNDIEKDADGNLIVTNKYFTATLKVPAATVPGTIGAPLKEVATVVVTLTDGENKEALPFVQNAFKAGDKLLTNCDGVFAVVLSVGRNTINLKLAGTPTTYRGAPVSITIPAGKVDGVKIAIKAISEESVWAVAMLDTVPRDESLGVPLNPAYDPSQDIGPENKKYDDQKPISYVDENGEKKERDPNEDITDSGEGWEWYPEKPVRPDAPGYDPKFPNGYVEKDSIKYKRPALILDDVDIQPGDPTQPGLVVPSDINIVVPPGTDNEIQGHPAILVGATVPATNRPELIITGPGELIVKGLPGPGTNPTTPGYPAIEGPVDPGNSPATLPPIIKVDPDVIINGDEQPMAPKLNDKGDQDPSNDEYLVPDGVFNDIIFGHVNAILSKLKKDISGSVNSPIAEVPNVEVVLQNATLKPNTVRIGDELATNSAGIVATVTDTLPNRTGVIVTLGGTPVEPASTKVTVTMPGEYVLEGATILATSASYRWAIVTPSVAPDPKPDPGPGTITSGGGGGKTQDVDIKKDVKTDENGNKKNIFTPDKKDMDKVVEEERKGGEIVFELRKDKNVDDVTLKLNGGTLEDMIEKNIDIKIVEGNITIEFPAKDLDIKPIVEKLGGEAKDVDVNIRVYEPTEEEKKAIADQILKDGSEQTSEPISFEITVEKDGKTLPLGSYDGFVEVSIRITAEQAKLITTAVTWVDGKLLHIPTEVFLKDGKHYAKVNALVNCTTTLIFNKQTFGDTAGTWYEAVASEMASRKIMNGVGDGKFAGDKNITRSEFAAIVVRALGLPMTSEGNFTDIAGTEWYAEVAATAANYGIVLGTDGKFMPNNQITRQEAMAMVARAAKMAELTGTVGDISTFPDSGEVAEWAKEAAAMTIGTGLVKGSDGQLRPGATITRSESAVLILRLLQTAELVDVRSAT